MNNVYDKIVIGGGASGLFFGAVSPGPGLILEGSSKPGSKLLMSGSGQCNITHSGSIKDFPAAYGSNGSKIRGCLYKYSNRHLMDFCQSNGIPLLERDDGKIFPASFNAGDVLDMLKRKCLANGFEIRTSSRVTSICFKNERYLLTLESTSGFHTSSTPANTVLSAKTVVIATGGASYPVTGSDGAMWNILSRELGIDIIAPHPALTSVKVDAYPYSQLAGMSFDKALVTVMHNEKKAAQTFGALLFAHRNLSGPAILDISKYASAKDRLIISYTPEAYDSLKGRLLALLNGHSPSEPHSINLIARDLDLPRRFVSLLCSKAHGKMSLLVNSLCSDEFTITGTGGFKEAMATAGGIALHEINPATMELLRYPGLYAIGEALDIDGRTGGFNLQFAYSSAAAVSQALSPDKTVVK